ncbi:alkanesulfonate monooxygenase SsuD/methylene tetrahydromethanopterin reductase-like flavin-dependent oxidoreductase (luciferase family) [Asanoa ferruginea]|uniref:Alkanesulfonate monooxygenase SsuD/methylene tetrahydromethanopterin reductase-like flavin-dependent oxidoreductase (Luciferase family) n=1 Tax=Asanoa ferruginea TaxID=53367 RepID=A0A3D9ZFF4_9ACTN|nr:LLM class flavin-dependent oxidoreductase [Asanoa ferruginea]REF95977.1 alkanesulfonate monooxygenase SsuD/methylene tetrahydromethanopterin reductase-like flavin-dependent oxidoreductase (luciferase family) [Asanoa ferruginea]GIF48162.1 N5,N10-methylene tetrahydromethanopterin reductase [Asanoa ferruginea]
MILFGFGAHSGIDDGPELLRMAQQADRDGLDLFSLSDHPYLGGRLDAYASIGFILGRTRHIAGFANVTNLPTRPAPMLARTVTTLSALSGGRIVLGMGAGGLWDRIADLGVPRLSPGAAVDAFEEAIVLIKRLSGGGPPVTFRGRYHQLEAIEPAPVAGPAVWTGSVGPKSLAATGRVADGWIPGHAADWLSERYRTSRPLIDEAAMAEGRLPREIRSIFNLPGRITDRPLAATRDGDNRWVGGSVAQWVEELTGAVLEHAASGFMLFSPKGGTPDVKSLRRWATEIAPAVREASKKAP